MWVKPCNRNAEESFPVLSLKSREQKPPNPLLIQDKNVLQPRHTQPRQPCIPEKRWLGIFLERYHPEKTSRNGYISSAKRGVFVKHPVRMPASTGSVAERLRPPGGSVWARLAPSSIGGRSRCSDVGRAAWMHSHTPCAPSAGPRVPRAPTPRQGCRS